MEKLDECEKKKSGGIKGLFSKVRTSIETTVEEIKSDNKTLLHDLLIFAVGFVLSRCQLLLGARPLGIAFVALLQNGVWPALLGVSVGSLSLGSGGIIFAVASLITALLRMAASISERRERGEGVIFHESLLLRLSISVIGGFIVAVFEALTEGLKEATLIYGLAMILLTPLIAFLLSGICSSGIGFSEVFGGSEDILGLSGCEKKKKYDRIFFQISSLALIFFLSLSFKSVSILGISFSYVFSGIITLLTAKRFGALRAMGVGFVSSLVMSGELAVAFALAGLCSGVMISFGAGYAVVAGGVALSAWSAYTVGLEGLLSTLPEYMISAAIAVPLMKRVSELETTEGKEELHESSEDMVGTMALAYQKDYSGSIERLDATLRDLGEIVNKYIAAPMRLSFDEYREIVIRSVESVCDRCDGRDLCAKDGIRPAIKRIDRICEMLCDGKKIRPEDLNTLSEFCFMSVEIADKINSEVTQRERERQLLSGIKGVSDEYEMMAQLIEQARLSDLAEKTVDNSMTEALTSAFESCGFKNGTIRVFGDHDRYFVLAGEDEGGSKISSFELRKSIEAAAGVKLGVAEYFRRGKMVLMQCGIRPSYKVSYATATEAGRKSEISGDTSVCFESGRGYFYSLISDGMGSGRLAKETSDFVSKYIRRAMEIGAAKETLLYMLNHSIRARGEECSATVDLFELDLLRGGGVFIKSGAPPSYVKRDSSIFRIRSHTAPIGLMRSIDTERISVEIKGGDHIIMISDGIAEIAEDAPWLLLLLGEAARRDLKEYASLILSEAKRNGASGDDMTVTVIRIDEV